MVLSATQLERYGYLEVRDYLDSLNVNSKLVKKILGRMRLRDIAECLLILGKITTEECDSTEEINEERNKFVHRKEGYKFSIGTKANEEYEPFVKEAIRILKEKLNAIRMVFV